MTLCKVFLCLVDLKFPENPEIDSPRLATVKM